jgi:exosortase A-associated hydrolase 2
MDAPIHIEPSFLDGPNGKLFSLYLTPVDLPVIDSILYCPPFAEEMNKSRRMAALQSRALAARGYAVLQIDLTGCGDSTGDFGEATWTVWREDLRAAYAWLRGKASGSSYLWGLRTGALLAVDIARQLPDIQGLVLWQPVTDGERFLNQFLRIKLATEMLSEGISKQDTKSLRSQLHKGTAIEVGGYTLAPEMAGELAELKLADMTPSCPVTWLDIGAENADQLSLANRRIVDAWQSTGLQVMGRTLQAEPFWTTQEIMECPALIQATLDALAR